MQQYLLADSVDAELEGKWCMVGACCTQACNYHLADCGAGRHRDAEARCAYVLLLCWPLVLVEGCTELFMLP